MRLARDLPTNAAQPRRRRRGLAAWLRRVAPARARGVVSVALVSDAPRPRAEPHVPAQGLRDRRPVVPASLANRLQQPQSPVPSRFLGDIVIARGVARRQAREAGTSERTELRVLALHGLLHLLGYDHERDDGRMRARAERRLRAARAACREGLIERARAVVSLSNTHR